MLGAYYYLVLKNWIHSLLYYSTTTWVSLSLPSPYYTYSPYLSFPCLQPSLSISLPPSYSPLFPSHSLSYVFPLLFAPSSFHSYSYICLFPSHIFTILSLSLSFSFSLPHLHHSLPLSTTFFLTTFRVLHDRHISCYFDSSRRNISNTS